MNLKNNPLLVKFDTAPFGAIKNEHFLPAITMLIEETREEIDSIANNPDLPTFENTIEALEFSGEQLDRVTSIFFNLNSAETNPEIQKIAQEVSPLLTELRNDILLNESLFERVKSVYENKSGLPLTSEQKMLLNRKYKSFSRNGANLTEDQKRELRKIDTELSKLSLSFGENVLAETNRFELQITDESELNGLPEGVIEAAKLLAEEREKEGWIFTLDYPSYLPFMTYADNRDLRKKMAIAFGAKGFQQDELDNQKIVLKIVQLRHKRANLLGYQSHAHFVLEERMAKTPATVLDFLNDLLEKAKPAALEEFKELTAFAKKLDNIDRLEKWDSAYYSEKLKQERFDLDDEKLKPYFELRNVVNGVFQVSKKLFGLNFKEIETIEKYHPDVRTYEVTDEKGDFKAFLYADFHPRAGKRNGAWMTSYKNQQKKNGKNERPHISIVCNFTKPTATKPSLLTFNEVTTLFHEFGHALHGMLANTTYPSLSGTGVYWDFVELPSQILENWCYEEEALRLFARHFQTDELIPMEYVEKIRESSNFQEGMATIRQLSFGFLDMAWHHTDPSDISDVKAYELAAFRETQLYPDVANNCMSTSFSHIFQGGYSSGYYSYKWAEVLDADAFELFKEKGVFNKEVAENFKENILSKGGTEEPMVLFERFRGHRPDNTALLKRAGLI
ncbi:MAG TPA: M3 family metallopeptidase [Flavobacteriaceae bacterium]|nr:M3 family metallopeptidase [Flavobacteriaceae bacterium]